MPDGVHQPHLAGDDCAPFAEFPAYHVPSSSRPICVQPAESSSATALTCVERAAARRLGRRHHRALDDRRVADDDPLAPFRLQHLDRHLAVGLGAAEIDEDGDALRRPGAR